MIYETPEMSQGLQSSQNNAAIDAELYRLERLNSE